MIQITPQLRVLVAVESVDGRKGIDSLAALCRQKLEADPFSGWLFVFRTGSAQAIKILCYDGQGFWMAQKAPRSFSGNTSPYHFFGKAGVRCLVRSPGVQALAGAGCEIFQGDISDTG